jgi:hypothetical protein
MYIPSFNSFFSKSLPFSSLLVSLHVVSVRVIPSSHRTQTQIVRFYARLSVCLFPLSEKPVPILCRCYMAIYLHYLRTYYIRLFTCSSVVFNLSVREVRNSNVVSFELMNVWIGVLSTVECPRQIFSVGATSVLERLG